MNKKAIVILICIFFFSAIPIAQTTDQSEYDYTSLKNEYINNHPGQAIIPYPWEPTTSIKVLPFNNEIPAAPANDISITVSRNEFESASFIINAQKDLSGITFSVPNLYNAQGNSIPADAIDIRTVKVWYQCHNPEDENYPGLELKETVLTPELLLKDDSLVKVDYVNKTNYLKVSINGSQQYIDISNPAGTFPRDAKIHDTPSLQPFSMMMNENKQIWLTVYIPFSTPTGQYSGDITITTPSETPVIVKINVKVLPFELEPAPLEYGLYYLGTLPAIASEEQKEGINSVWKSPEQYSLELQDMKDHGVLYPTIYQWYDNWTPYIQTFKLALSLREQTGLPNDHIYIFSLETGNSTDPSKLTVLADNVIQLKNVTSQYGYQEVYIYGIDEAGGDILRSERSAWQTVQKSGAKVFVASWKNSELIDNMGDILDLAVLGTEMNKTQALLWHNYGHKIFLYNQPQVAIENPEIYRRNYGFVLWNAGYDGAIDFAYQFMYGKSIWNDFDNANIRDHVFAYPTSNGVIDTIQWEGWREGVDDTRYLATLIKHEGSDTSARAIVADSLSTGENMASIREKVIGQILINSSTNNKQKKIDIFNDVWNFTTLLRNMGSWSE